MPCCCSCQLVGRIGSSINFIPACFGVRPPFFMLHGAQAVMMFSHVVFPPRRRGTTWSKVRWLGLPQYWQVNRSRRNTLNRVKAGQRAGSLKSMVFGGEGLFLATLRGTGRVWLQSLPFSRLADRVIAHAPSIGGKSKGEGSLLGNISQVFED